MSEGPDRFQDLLEQLAAELKARGIRLPGVVTGQWGTFGRFIRGGWRSAAAWVCVLILIINGAVLPIARLFHFQGEPLDWPGLATFVAGLVALAHYRSKDLQSGVTS